MEEKELREKNDKNERVKKKGERRQQGRRERKTSGESLRLVVEEGEGEGRRGGEQATSPPANSSPHTFPQHRNHPRCHRGCFQRELLYDELIRLRSPNFWCQDPHIKTNCTMRMLATLNVV